MTDLPSAAPPIIPVPMNQTQTVGEAQRQAVANAAETGGPEQGAPVKGLVKHVRAAFASTFLQASLQTIPALFPIRCACQQILSREQQLLFKQITEALIGDSAELRQSALESLAQDPGQHQLVPFFVEFATNQVTHNLKNLRILGGMVAMIRSLFSNPNVLLELYVSAAGLKFPRRPHLC